jgi:hypothetical protein
MKDGNQCPDTSGGSVRAPICGWVYVWSKTSIEEFLTLSTYHYPYIQYPLGGTYLYGSKVIKVDWD